MENSKTSKLNAFEKGRFNKLKLKAEQVFVQAAKDNIHLLTVDEKDLHYTFLKEIQIIKDSEYDRRHYLLTMLIIHRLPKSMQERFFSSYRKLLESSLTAAEMKFLQSFPTASALIK